LGILIIYLPDGVRREEAPDIPKEFREAPATTLVPPEISSGRPGPHLVGLCPTFVQKEKHLSMRKTIFAVRSGTESNAKKYFQLDLPARVVG